MLNKPCTTKLHSQPRTDILILSLYQGDMKILLSCVCISFVHRIHFQLEGEVIACSFTTICVTAMSNQCSLWKIEDIFFWPAKRMQLWKEAQPLSRTVQNLFNYPLGFQGPAVCQALYLALKVKITKSLFQTVDCLLKGR